MPPLPPNDDSADNHEQWFAEEVYPHKSRLRSWLHARFPWMTDVDDVVQDSLSRLWRRQTQPGREPIHSGKAALFAIARNLATDQARHQGVVSIDSVADMSKLAVLDDTDVAEAVSVRQELEFLADALRELPARCRQVITLTKIYGYTEREVAERLGISEHTVRTQVVRGMRRCMEYLRRKGVKPRGQ